MWVYIPAVDAGSVRLYGAVLSVYLVGAGIFDVEFYWAEG